VALHVYPDSSQAEVACLFVAEPFTNQGIGRRLLRYVEGVARGLGVEQLFCLSTQAFNFFCHKGGFVAATAEVLPPPRRDRYERSGRRSQVLVKSLGKRQ
jgi:amino-acid N-acetyltransferase